MPNSGFQAMMTSRGGPVSRALHARSLLSHTRFIFTGLTLVLLSGACGGDEAPTPAPAFEDVSVTDADVDGEEDVPLTCAELGNGAPCDDGNACTTGDQCEYEVCAGGTTTVCDDFGICVTGECDPEVGCVYEPEPDGTVCYVACFGEAQCINSECTVVPESAVQCPAPENPCLAQWACDPLTGTCSKAILKPDGVSCDSDESVCTEELCEVGECVATGVVETCEEVAVAKPCWSHTCDPEKGCIADVFKEGQSCDDSASCTVDDQCTYNDFGQELCLGTPIVVDDGNPCTNDVCVAGVVENTPFIGSVCDPEHPCADKGICDDQGVCVPTVSCSCSTLDDCPEGATSCLESACVF